MCEICFFLLILARGAFTEEDNIEELHAIDKINISAFVTDFSETDQSENVSNIFCESSDVINLNLLDSSSLHLISNPEDFIVMDYAHISG